MTAYRELFLVAFSTTFILVFESSYITFYGENEKRTWKEAANFCMERNAILESNITEVKRELSDMNTDVWLGIFHFLTPWSYVYGCFDPIQSNYTIVTLNSIPECQMRCLNTNYFTVKDSKCICIEDITIFTTSAGCKCGNCFRVIKHNIGDFPKRLIPNGVNQEEFPKCIVAECENNVTKRTCDNCDRSFTVKCENNVSNTVDKTHLQGEMHCDSNNSLLKWYSETSCTNDDLSSRPHWTSGKRYQEKFNLTKKSNITGIALLKCVGLTDSKGEKDYDCNNKSLPFFCRYGEGNTPESIFVPNNSRQASDVESTSDASIIGGSVGALLAAGLMVAGIAIYHRRVNSNKSSSSDVKKCTISQETDLYSEVDDESSKPKHVTDNPVQTTTYNTRLFTSEPAGIRKANELAHDNLEYHIITPDGTSSSKYTLSESGSGKAKFAHLTTNNYCIAKPIADTDIDPYSTNTDYDHLNNIAKKEQLDIKVYDHLSAGCETDPTYDHSNRNNLKCSDGTYDHFGVKA